MFWFRYYNMDYVYFLIMLILNIIVIDSLNKILKIISKLIPLWPRISQSILF